MLRSFVPILVGAGLLLTACAPASQPASSTTAPAAAPTTAAKPAAPTIAPQPAAPTTAPPPATAAGAAQPSGPAKKVGIAYSNLIADSLSLWVARESGIFAKNGLDVDLQYIASSNAFAALLAGQVQASAGGGSEVISGIANGADVMVVANLMPI
ncbi:MAG: ABC transporter substrate-binding protein, partial [Chloroflexi bacterium]|nr:ABC transporter substrate-binding protein [Chloroflexota bacterium]